MAHLILGFRSMTNSKRPIKTPEDAKGIRMRTLEALFVWIHWVS